MPKKASRPRCFLDISVDGVSAGRVVVELFADVCPITCENFRALCTGEKGKGQTTGKPLHYKGSTFHRVVKNFMVQGGDFSAANGTGGESIYGGAFDDENFDMKHDAPMLLSMANRGKNTNGSQFFIITRRSPHLDGVHVVFGKVVSGESVVTEVEGQKADANYRAQADITITNCGELKLKEKKRKRRHSASDADDLSPGSPAADQTVPQLDDAVVPQAPPDLSTVKAEEVPDVPANKFLMRRSRTPPERRAQRDGADDNRRRPPPAEGSRSRRSFVSRSGHRIRGRGAIRYRTPSPGSGDARSGSETPPHWRREQARVLTLDALRKRRERQEKAKQDDDSDDGGKKAAAADGDKAEKRRERRRSRSTERRRRRQSSRERPERGERRREHGSKRDAPTTRRRRFSETDPKEKKRRDSEKEPAPQIIESKPENSESITLPVVEAVVDEPPVEAAQAEQ